MSKADWVQVVPKAAHEDDSDTSNGTTKDTPDATAYLFKDEVGLTCEAKNLYPGKAKCDCCVNWSYEYPEDVAPPTPHAEKLKDSQRYALLLRHRRAHVDAGDLKLDCVVVQSPLLKELLGEVFHQYVGVTANLANVVFRPPFKEFFYRWKQFERAIHKAKGTPKETHGKLLQAVISSELGETMTKHRDLAGHGVITFDYLWTIFAPGELVYTSNHSHDALLRVNSCSESVIDYSITCKYVDFDGAQLGYSQASFNIERFEGTREITDLKIYPAKFHPSLPWLKEALVARGKLFASYAGPHYRAYKGLSVTRTYQRDESDDESEGEADFSSLKKRTKHRPTAVRSCFPALLASLPDPSSH